VFSACLITVMRVSISTIEKSIEVNVPVYVAYSQWTRLAEFPRFMDGVKEVKQLDGKRLHWKAEIAGQATEWDADSWRTSGSR
jgi:uncharacterized membrane protein